MAHYQNQRPVGTTPNVRYGTVAPTVLATDKKGDEYLVTPSGSNTTQATQSWVFDGATWELRPVTILDGNHTPVLRAIATAGVLPIAAEVPAPILGDTASVKLSNGNEEFYRYNGAIWTLVYTNVAAVSIVPSTITPLADGVVNTRTGAVGTSLAYSRQDHIHPITKITPFATAPTITFQSFTTPTTTPIAMTYVRSTEETITYRWTGSLTIPNTAAWRNYTPSAVAGFTMETTTRGMYRTSNYTGYKNAPTMEKFANDNYAGSNTTYIYDPSTPGGVVTISNIVIDVMYTLN